MLPKFLIGLAALFGASSGGAKTSGILGSLGIVGGFVSAAWWLIGPGREIKLTLNLLELAAVLMTGGFVVLFALWQRSPRALE
jgi:hypothetical protein